MHMRATIIFISALVLFVGMTGCRTVRSLEEVDAKVQDRIRAASEQEFGEVPPEQAALDVYQRFETAGDEPVQVDLKSALLLAARHSRSYQTSRETLYRSALSLLQTSHQWDTTVDNGLGGMLARDFGAGDTTLSGDAGLSLGQRFLSGANLTMNLAFDSVRYLAGDHGVDLGTLANARLVQPLLAGGGPEIARENLTQAERNLIYALRAFVRQRKSLLIDVAEGYYDVLSAQDAMEIARQNHETLRSSRERSEAMAVAGRVPQFQVDQARQQELAAHASLVNRQEAFQSTQDNLKRLLGLPLDANLEVDRADLQRLVDASLPEPPMTLDAARQHALATRLDQATRVDQLDDARRNTRIAADALRARLDLVLTGSASSPRGNSLRNIAWDDGTYTVGVDADLPFDKTDEYIDYQRARIDEQRQSRAVDEGADEITANLRSVWRGLAASRQNIGIQQLSLQLAEQRIENTQLLFEAGRINIRELLDAQNDLISARNQYIAAIVDYRMNWLRLLYQLEDLPTDPDTLWSPALGGDGQTATP
jgi:outer membrane protein TolC